MLEMLTEELAAGADKDGPVAKREPATWTAAMERCFMRMDAEVTSARLAR